MSDAVEAVRTDPRISRRRKAIERSRKKRVWIGLCCAAAVAVLAWAAFWSPLLSVRTVRVIGSRHLTSSDIEQAAHLGGGTNILLLSTGAVVRDIERLPWVRRARVERSLPGTLRVRIVERRPVLVLANGSVRWLVDKHGNVIAPARAGHRRLATLAGIHLGAISAGMRLGPSSGGAALAVWRGLPPRLKHKVGAVFAPTVPAITFSLRDGTTVRYGGPEDSRDKNHVLLALLRRIARDGVTTSYIDVRVPTDPALGPPPAAASAAQAAPTSGTPSPAPSPT